MIRIDENGITCTKGDIFNLLMAVEPWDVNATYTCTATVGSGIVNFTCSLFRNKYVRVYSNNMNLSKGIGTIVMTKDGTEVMNRPFIVEEVAHNG